MIATTPQILYTQTRLGQTLLQADAATEGCARASHLGLADLYRTDLSRLNAAMLDIAPEAGDPDVIFLLNDVTVDDRRAPGEVCARLVSGFE
ncbi:hypothetical protein [Sphingomonas sp. PAMC 26621]|uniref:hypothetical protein n=1 Tax=Sphingomonas sp. PAMC 26621 TaxID=1112213 RepID=UPI000288CC21|nr:hypothetical protein [Sphingomonas sp. PAMC 26621]